MQEVSGVYTSLLLHADEREMALRARKVSGAFEKRAPGWQRSFHTRPRVQLNNHEATRSFTLWYGTMWQ